jgi:isoleucyl-tRNA synthetase
MDEKGQKMSKSLGNVVAPLKVIEQSGADILRLWVASVDYADDQRIGPEILKNLQEAYRKLRNTIRWMLGSLAHFTPADAVAHADMPELERYMLHRLAEIGGVVDRAYADYDYKKVVATLSQFMNVELSAFYVDIRKDALYCEPRSSLKRKAALTVIDILCDAALRWLAPILAFTADEAWAQLRPGAEASVHLTQFPKMDARWSDEALARRWELIRQARSVVTGALEIERAHKRIGSSLEAAPLVFVGDSAMRAALDAVDFAEICITSGVEIRDGDGPSDAFALPDVPGIAVMSARAPGVKCARSWRYFDPATADPAYPDITPRDAAAMRELEGAAEAGT